MSFRKTGSPLELVPIGYLTMSERTVPLSA
jgi:hypothetical protein